MQWVCDNQRNEDSEYILILTESFSLLMLIPLTHAILQIC